MKLQTKKTLYILIIILFFLAVILFAPSKPRHSKTIRDNIKIDLASEKIDPEKMWRNYFEDKLFENKDSAEKKLAEMQALHRNDLVKLQTENENNLANLRRDFTDANSNLRGKIDEIIELQKRNIDEIKEEKFEPNMEILNISDHPQPLETPYDSKSYISETSYVSGILIGGIAVSTSIGSASAPVPVVIRITGVGNFPKNFEMDLKSCRILGSAYGDLSSERAVIRAETLVCKKGNELIVTKVAGIIYGDDGMNGIKGRVIDMSSKHIKSAAFGSILSAFGNTMKREGDLSVTPFGTINQKEKNIHKNLRDNSLKGAGNAAEKIADYYIKQAEKMSPILQIPGGTKIDVVFTKGVYLGTRDVVKKIDLEKR